MESRSQSGHVGHAAAMVVTGAVCVVAGGIIAAVAVPLGLIHGSWLAAYLVLVCGVAQFVIGTVESGRGSGTEPTPRRMGWLQVVCFNVGNAGVVAGTLMRIPLVVDGAAVLLLGALGIALHGARPRSTDALAALAGFSADSWASRFLMWVYRVFLVLLVVSVPFGAVLAHLRAA